MEIVRYNKSRDREIIMEGNLDAFRESFPGLPITEQVEAWVGDSVPFSPEETEAATFTALMDGAPAGFVTVGMTWFFSIPQGLIHALYVSPGYRRRGAGRALLLAAERWSRSQGAQSLKLDVSVVNEAAREMYEKCGFVISRLEMECWIR